MNNYNSDVLNTTSDRAYTAAILRGLLNNDRPEEIDWDLLNGHGDLVEELIDVFDVYGSVGVSRSWEAESSAYPELFPYMKPLMHISDLKHLPDPTWLVEPFLPEGEVVLVYGPPASGKSFWVLDLAMQVAKHSSVVYVAAEGVRGYRNRTAAWSKYYDEEVNTLPFNFVVDPPQLMDAVSVDAFISRILPHSPKLVVIDTVAQCFIGGDENGSASMSLFVAGCQEIQRATGATVLLVHHSTKSNSDIERGSGALKGAVQAAISLKKAEDGIVTVSCKKMKDAEGFANRKYRLQQVGLDNDQSSCVIVPLGSSKKALDQATKDVRPEDELKPSTLKVLDVVAEAGKDGIANKGVVQATGLNSKLINEARKTLLESGLINQSRKGAPYVITEAGQTFLEDENNRIE